MDTTPNQQRYEKLPPYLPFKTFQSSVQNLRTHGLPNKLDRTAWNSQSGGMQNLIIGAFRFLGLIDASENTQPILKKLVDATENSPQEKSIISSLLHEAYQNVFQISLETATVGQVEDAIGDLGVTGSTRDRAVRFFIKAAQFSGVPLLSRLTAGLRSSSEATPSNGQDNGVSTVASQAKAKRKRRVSSTATATSVAADSETVSGKAVKTITLRHVVGELTLSGTFNPFELDGGERKLVYDIIDLMKKYEQEGKPAAE